MTDRYGNYSRGRLKQPPSCSAWLRLNQAEAATAQVQTRKYKYLVIPEHGLEVFPGMLPRHAPLALHALTSYSSLHALNRGTGMQGNFSPVPLASDPLSLGHHFLLSAVERKVGDHYVAFSRPRLQSHPPTFP